MGQAKRYAEKRGKSDPTDSRVTHYGPRDRARHLVQHSVGLDAPRSSIEWPDLGMSGREPREAVVGRVLRNCERAVSPVGAKPLARSSTARIARIGCHEDF